MVLHIVSNSESSSTLRSNIPIVFHAELPSSNPVFSKDRLRSKTFFSCRICSIVILEADELPVSRGKPASLRNVSRVLSITKCSAPYHAGTPNKNKHLVIVVCPQITSYDYGGCIEVRHFEDKRRICERLDAWRLTCISNCHETNAAGGAPMTTAG